MHEELSQGGGLSPARIIESTDPKELKAKYEEWKKFNFNKTNKSVISDLFYSHVVQTLKCKSCNVFKFNFSFCSALALEISTEIHKFTNEECPPQLEKTISLNSDTFTLDDLVKRYFQQEAIEDYKCHYCKKNTTVIKEQFLIHCPPILLIFFKRFNMHEAKPRKLDTKIIVTDFTLLDVLPTPGESGAYDLMGFIKHYGGINSGHYVASLRKDNHWVSISDDKSSAEDLYKMSIKGSSEVYLCAFASHIGD